MRAAASPDVAHYISGFPADVQQRLEQVRSAIRETAPEATESISYDIPSYSLQGALVYFAGWKTHVAVYPVPKGDAIFEQDIAPYRKGKGTLQFSHKQPLPLELISRLVKFRLEENMQKSQAKKTLRTCPNGHKFYKSSSCPTCPVCEAERKPEDEFLSALSAPARRALENQGIRTPDQLSQFTEAQILALHGMGPASLPKLRSILESHSLAFRVK